MFEKVKRGNSPVHSGKIYFPGLSGSGGNDNKVKFAFQLLKFLFGQRSVQMDLSKIFSKPLQFVINHFIGNAALRNGVRNLAPQFLSALENKSFMAFHPQLPRHGEPRRATADNGYLFTGSGKRLGFFRFQRCFSQHGHIHGWQVDRFSGTILHAQIRAEITANRRRKRRIFQREIDCLLHFSFPDEFPSFLNGNACGAMRLTGRQIFFIGPNRNKTA